MNLANPKALVFFAAVLPTFVGSATQPTAQMLTLGLIVLAAGFTFNVAVGNLISTTSKRGLGGRVGWVLDRVGGVTLAALGIATVGAALL